MARTFGSGFVWSGRKIGNIVEATEEMAKQVTNSNSEKLPNSQDNGAAAPPHTISTDIDGNDADTGTMSAGNHRQDDPESK